MDSDNTEPKAQVYKFDVNADGTLSNQKLMFDWSSDKGAGVPDGLKVDSKGNRCENRRWLDVHHVVPRAAGGSNAPENLITLCSAHHRIEHDRTARAFGVRRGP